MERRPSPEITNGELKAMLIDTNDERFWDILFNEANVEGWKAAQIEKALKDIDVAEEYIQPPCKIGDTLYDISDFLDNRNSPEIEESKCRSLTLIGYKEKEPLWYVNGIEFTQSDIGVRIFLLKTDAVSAIEALQKSQEQTLTM